MLQEGYLCYNIDRNCKNHADFYSFFTKMALKETQTYEELRKQLQKSPTAYAAGAKATDSDLAKQVELMKRRKTEEAAAAEEAKMAWYGDETEKKGETKEGFLPAFLASMGAPMSAMAGATEMVLGKGTKSGLANIPENVKERGTFGDIIRSYGVNNAVAMPIGFALDVFADPLSWATLGTTATIPRIAMGAMKGGVSGAALGAKSAALMKSEFAGRVIPGLAKRAFATTDDAYKGPVATFYKELAKKSADAAKEYDQMVGKTLNDRLMELADRTTIFEAAENKLRQTAKGDALMNLFGYSNKSWMQAQREKAMARLAEKGAPIEVLQGGDELGPLLRGTNAKAMPKGRVIEENIRDSADLISNDFATRATDSLEMTARMRNLGYTDEAYRMQIEDEVRGVKQLLEEQGYGSAAGRVSSMLAGEGEEAFKKKEELASVFNYFKSELGKYDAQVARAISSDTGRKFLKNYATYIGLFKNAKIGGNLLSAGTNAVVGNLVMTSMLGVDVLNNKLFSAIGDAISVIRAKDLNKIRAIASQPDIANTLRQYPELFEGVFGINPALMTEGKAYIDRLAQEFLKKGGKLDDLDEVKKTFDEIVGDRMAQAMTKGRSGLTSTIQALESGAPSTYMSAEIMRGPFGDFRNKIGQMAEEGKPFAKFFHWYLTKPMEAYNKVDQTYRLGLALHLSRNGVNEKELRLLARRVNIRPQDIKQVEGQNLYKINFDKAMDLSTEAYMNYLAMPAFVQIMRTLPIMGAPFFSFVYGIGALGAKALAYNPAFINKVQFLQKEISGRRSPLEKEMLESPYYQWYDKEGMTKLNTLPFFEDNPVYLNMENMIPYYTMNMFQPVERTYDSRFGNIVAAMLDKTPFVKTPEGQVMFDYMILPLLLRDTQPQGTFGQPLWTQEAGFLEKAGVTARAAAETVMPPMSGYAGLATPSSLAPYIPNYRWRQLAYAKEGKGSLGVPTKEDPVHKTWRVMSAMAGLPIYQMKLRYSEKDNK